MMPMFEIVNGHPCPLCSLQNGVMFSLIDDLYWCTCDNCNIRYNIVYTKSYNVIFSNGHLKLRKVNKINSVLCIETSRYLMHLFHDRCHLYLKSNDIYHCHRFNYSPLLKDMNISLEENVSCPTAEELDTYFDSLWDMRIFS